MKKILLVLVMAFISVCALANPEIIIPIMSKAPSIDGVIDENEWAESVEITGFCQIFTGNNTFIDTEAYLGYCEGKLYIAYKSYSPEKPQANATDRQLGEFWLDEDIEIFIAPNINEKGLYQILTNATGKFRDCTQNNLPFTPLNIETKARICDGFNKLGATAQEKRWEGEMAINLSEMGIDINKNQMGIFIMRHSNFLGNNDFSNIGFLDVTNNFEQGLRMFNPDCYTKVTFEKVPPVHNYNGRKFKVNESDNLELSLFTDKEVYKGPIKSHVDYSEYLPFGILNYTYTVKTGDKVLLKNTVISSKNKYLTTNMNKNKLLVEVDLNDITREGQTNLTIMKGTNTYFGFSIHIIPGQNNKFVYEYDFDGLPKGTYRLDFSIGKFYSETKEIEYR